MSKNLRLNLILLLGVMLLALLVWYAQPRAPTPLTAIDPTTISRIEISDLTGRYILLQKEGDAWQTQGGPARKARIEQLLGICGTTSLESFPAADKLGAYGLEPAAIRLKLNDETLDFGATDPLHGWRYVRYGDRIHLIADGFYHHLSAPADAWREAP
jgi:hypothetical protein